jgi:hypothetical protein
MARACSRAMLTTMGANANRGFVRSPELTELRACWIDSRCAETTAD